MNKKNFKEYETPTVEILDVDLEDQLMAGSNPDDGITRPKPIWDDSRTFEDDDLE